MIESLEIHHLRTLDALYTYQNLSSVAEHLNISQQAVSLKLKKMRDILSDSLFVREGHGMVPTPYAKQVQFHIEKVLTDLNAIPLAVADLNVHREQSLYQLRIMHNKL